MTTKLDALVQEISEAKQISTRQQEQDKEDRIEAGVSAALELFGLLFKHYEEYGKLAEAKIDSTGKLKIIFSFKERPGETQPFELCLTQKRTVSPISYECSFQLLGVCYSTRHVSRVLDSSELASHTSTSTNLEEREKLQADIDRWIANTIAAFRRFYGTYKEKQHKDKIAKLVKELQNTNNKEELEIALENLLEADPANDTAHRRTYDIKAAQLLQREKLQKNKDKYRAAYKAWYYKTGGNSIVAKNILGDIRLRAKNTSILVQELRYAMCNAAPVFSETVLVVCENKVVNTLSQNKYLVLEPNGQQIYRSYSNKVSLSDPYFLRPGDKPIAKIDNYNLLPFTYYCSDSMMEFDFDCLPIVAWDESYINEAKKTVQILLGHKEPQPKGISDAAAKQIRKDVYWDFKETLAEKV